MKTTLQLFHEGMRSHFRVTGNPGLFLDTIFIQLGKQVKLDVIKFDDLLHARHGEYEADGLSMRECIAKHYSEDAARFVESLI